MFIFLGCNSEESRKAIREAETTQINQMNMPKEILEDEDCESKAKKEIEIPEESLSLQGGDAGCTLD
jgi:hypothetical protein